MFIKEVRVRINAYLELTLRNLRDMIPKIIGQLFVNKTLSILQMEILEGINKNKEVLEALNEVDIYYIARTHQVGERDPAEDPGRIEEGPEEVAEGGYNGKHGG